MALQTHRRRRSGGKYQPSAKRRTAGGDQELCRVNPSSLADADALKERLTSRWSRRKQRLGDLISSMMENDRMPCKFIAY